MEHVDHFRKAAAALHRVQRERGIKVVMVASAVPGEGKSITAASLARTLSRAYGRRVLLIDADLRRPVLHDLGCVSNEYGLDETLQGDAAIVALPTSTIGPNLELLPAGRPTRDPIEVLTSPRMRELLTFATNQFDWVLLDTPPVALLPDTELLGSMIDGALLVVAAGQTDYRLVTKAVEVLGRDRVLGVVLNKVDRRELGVSLEYAYAG